MGSRIVWAIGKGAAWGFLGIFAYALLLSAAPWDTNVLDALGAALIWVTVAVPATITHFVLDNED